jgi:serine/threonine protein phosphatase PrpC
MRIEFSASSVVGRRNNNEDQLCADPELGLFVVADGMGGYEGGEIASRIAVEELREFVGRNRRDPGATWPCGEDKKRAYSESLLHAATLRAHQQIVAHRTERLRNMGSTIVTLLLEDGRATCAHVGDSRLYRLRSEALVQLTRDHSFWAELEAAGGTEVQRKDFGWKNQITRALGVDGSHRADTASLDLLPGDVWLLCSDGLYDPLEPEQIAEALKLPDAKAACEAIVQRAFEAGSQDNITAIVVRVLP